MASVELTRGGLGPAVLEIRDHEGRTVFELTYMTDSMARIALEQISSAFGMTIDEGAIGQRKQTELSPKPASETLGLRFK